jgi:hypothetical protein
MPDCRIVAVADADEAKPDIVAVAPRWIDQHRDMVVRRLLEEGAIERVFEFRGRGKEDQRGAARTYGCWAATS